MAEVAAMGEVDEIHSNDESVMVNGDVAKETVEDVDMVEAKKLPTEEDEEMKAEEDTSLDSGSNKDVEMDATSQSNIDEDSEDSQDAKSAASSQSSQDQIPENGEVANEDTNSSSMQNENSNVSSAKNDDDDDDEEDSGSSTSDSKDNENSQPDKTIEMDEEKMEISENGMEDQQVASPASSSDDVQEIVKPHDTIELNSEDESDIQILDGKTNGSDEVIELIDSPEKKTPPPKNVVGKRTSLTPRRSSRNVNKSKNYVENEKDNSAAPRASSKESGESDIEEVLPQDPLADNNQITVERVSIVKKPSPEQKASTIVVKDTKRLVEIANKTNQSSSGSGQSGKKEPTLVIIDTNSILSGRGPVPASLSNVKSSSSSFANVLPMAVPAQGLYPANMRATITPIPASNQHHKNVAAATAHSSAAPLLPTLTDDMFVVEAPSFIVPYVYEKPPVKVLKEYIAEIKKQIEDNKKEEKAKKRAKKQERKENKEKAKDDEDASDDATSSSDEEVEEVKPEVKKPYSYFESPLGKFFTDIGSNLVKEYVQTDLLKQQKRKRDREQGANAETNKTITALIKTIEMSRSTNQHFKMEIKKCEFCNFKTESKLAMAYHLETPHMKNFVYKCNFCAYEVRSPHDILFHMEAEHAVRGHLERAPAFHQCPSCPFEDNQKGKLSRHLVVCARKFKPDRNLEPPPDWEPPAKIPRLPKMRATGLNAAVAAYQTLTNKGAQQYQFLSKMQLQQANATASTSALNRGRGRPTLGPNVKSQPMIRPQGMIFKQQSGGQMLVPANYQLSGNQVYQTTTSQQQNAKKPSNTPSISITPLPRTSSTATPAASKPGDTSSKNSFVICEICDGYIKDLEQLRNHMQWIHKIKIHPKMIYNRPPLNCQKCQFRFFTDQGLERHLLGSHGLVTSSMQENANKSKDSGRCPVCGRVYQWKLLNHVARDHNMTLKPAHLSYKCTVCTATFGMYKQFENHVYSAHSVVAKRVMDKKTTSAASASSTKNSTDMKPLKINDEITIIPQPAKSTNGKESMAAKSTATAGTSKSR